MLWTWTYIAFLYNLGTNHQWFWGGLVQNQERKKFRPPHIVKKKFLPASYRWKKKLTSRFARKKTKLISRLARKKKLIESSLPEVPPQIINGPGVTGPMFNMIRFSWDLIKVWLNRYRWSAGKPGSEHIWWFRRIECIDRRFLVQSSVQIGLKMEAGYCPSLNMNAMWVISVKSYLKMHCYSPNLFWNGSNEP